MRDITLMRLSGICAIAGGLLRASGSFAGGVVSGDRLQMFYFATDVFLIFGLAGIYGAGRRSLGVLGLAGFVTAIVGLLIVRSGELFGGYRTGAAIALAGTVLLGLAMLLHTKARAAPLLWLSSLALGIASVAAPQIFLASALTGVTYGAGFVAAGYRLFSLREENAPN
jgi:hypothetical protein